MFQAVVCIVCREVCDCMAVNRRPRQSVFDNTVPSVIFRPMKDDLTEEWINYIMWNLMIWTLLLLLLGW